MARRRRRPGIPAERGVRDDVAGWSTLIVGALVTGLLYWYNYTNWQLPPSLAFSRYYLVNTACLIGIPALVVLLLLRRELSDFGMTPGDVRGGLIAALVLWSLFLPVIWYFSQMPDFQRQYVRVLTNSGALVPPMVYSGPQSDPRIFSAGGFLFHQTVMGFYFLGWEWFFRGYLLFGLKRVMPFAGAAFLQAAIFTLLHLGKPLPEMISSFPGALLLALVAIRYRSFLPCFVLHWAISLSFEAAVIYHHVR